MTKARAAILVLLTAISGFSVLWGFALESSARGIIVDFKVVYYGARCLLQHRDPYNENELMSVYLAEGGERPSNPAELERVRQVVALQVYVPTAFLCIAPFAMLSWGVAHMLWTALTVAAFTLAAFLMWALAQEHAPGASFYLSCFLLANCGILFAGGNAAGLAIGLCVVAAWCILEDKYTFAAVVCLAVSLALKPHDTGPVWLYFLLAGGAYRKRALQALALTVVIGLTATMWVSSVSPHWFHELSANLSATSVRGGITDPGPAAIGTGGGSIIDLQTVISVFRDDPRVYNSITYLTCGGLMIAWMVVTLRAKPSRSKDYLGLAAIAALSMLPVYHRPYDAKLLLLTLPACAMLLAEGGRLGKVAILLNSMAILITSDLPLAMLALLTKDLSLSTAGMPSKMLTIILARPIPIILLVLGAFYLWLYRRRCLSPSDLGVSRDDSNLRKSSQTVPG
ncbi:glycosyltransferase family 87 protein [Telmatobacter sp. DSM 110680]|uniref:Glycosyltransferase family 87 protein n=1 Tax=Telmatobacter sp. DSM 110680 TaxID=3036704 RepID=A0AAU7DH43_9BACT